MGEDGLDLDDFPGLGAGGKPVSRFEVRNTRSDGAEYVVLTLDRGDGRDPVQAVAFDGRFDQVMDLIDKDIQLVRLFGFFEKRDYEAVDESTGEVLTKTSRRYRILWAGEPRVEGERPQRRGRQQRSQGQGQNRGGWPSQQQGARSQGQRSQPQQRQQAQQGGARNNAGQNGRQQGGQQEQRSQRNGGGQYNGQRRQAQQGNGQGGWWPNT
ncbi:hypothetical protein WV31_10000 [Magnetospirillum sp. ME-1]|uniref:OB-fold nucleic acid binding domain-containing protein n=1 Tax=Magnetospirillum sp. ME-1 TaxID=1639348 RepID=UPI000A17F28D|nr:hypothetical protein [Magnetospirillum sp. ME-1]ARJ65960.1 hypothetical protein WV31_10000 [Magnetospirillum sp. ME-1]